MAATQKESKRKRARVAWGTLPPRMRVLHITTYHRTGGWLADALAADNATQVLLEEVLGLSAGLAKLRDEAFDAVLVSHEPGELDALELAAALRGGGAEEPLIVLGEQSEQEMTALGYEVGADAYICVNSTTTRTLIWALARSIERHRLVVANRKLAQSEQHHLEQEHQEAERLLEQQRALIHDLEARRPGEPSLPLPERLVLHYRELLRTYVIMGTGNLGSELSELAEMLATAGMSARQTMQLHVVVLEELVRGLGSRSTRHVMTRADMLVLEVLVHLAEGYRLRYQRRLHPERQLLLPGFDSPTTTAFASPPAT